MSEIDRAFCLFFTFSQNRMWKTLDLDREKGCIRDVEHAYSQDGGLAGAPTRISPPSK